MTHWLLLTDYSASTLGPVVQRKQGTELKDREFGGGIVQRFVSSGKKKLKMKGFLLWMTKLLDGRTAKLALVRAEIKKQPMQAALLLLSIRPDAV
ncbi:hypothetical protein A8L45_18045 [Veronia pacifica]|uniref:Uncharacterized protein n=1 Tax=Veronia pacifica TaxID=1080227 RepID=A0A1C3ED28_9GAMM|nr:hypothetical protein A8L45_18045 [Veronia pacifica]